METRVKQCEKLWMSQKEARAYLGVSRDWLDERRENGILHFSKVGNTIFYIKSEIDKLIRNNAITGKHLFTQEVYKQ